MRTLALAGLAWLGVATAAQAGDWYVVSGDNDTGFAVDRESVRRQGSLVTVWVAAILNEPRPNETMGTTDYLLSRVQYDCDGETLRNLATHVYTVGGGLAFSHNDADIRPMAIPPESVASTILRVVCTEAFDDYEQHANVMAARDAWRAHISGA